MNKKRTPRAGQATGAKRNDDGYPNNTPSIRIYKSSLKALVKRINSQRLDCQPARGVVSWK